MKQGLIELRKHYSRQKSLSYMMMWDISDRDGYANFVHYKLNNSIFIYDPETEKVSVWHDEGELEKVISILKEKVSKKDRFTLKIAEELDNNWEKIFPFISGQQKIISVEQLSKSYASIVDWWSAMIVAYSLIDNPDIFQEVGEKFRLYREKSERYTGEMDKLIVDFFESKLSQEDRDLARYLLVEEFIRLINGELGASERSLIEKRKNGYFIFQKKVYLGEELENVLEKNKLVLHKENTDKITEFRGMSAFKGRAEGIVRKIIVHNDIKQFKEGEILVAETTFPDHVPAMKKAAAFVTDEGGVTCHASIVSRELKKPCIVGTKIATQVLKDGDLVEVDADKGVIRLLERNK